MTAYRKNKEIHKMSEFTHSLILRFIKWLNVILLVIPFAFVWMQYYAGRTSSPYYAKGNYFIIVLYAILYIVYGRIYEAFLVSVNRISEMVYSQALSLLITNGIAYLVIWLLTKLIPNPLPLLFVYGLQLMISCLWAVASHHWYFRTFRPKRTIIVYDFREGMEELISEYGMESKFNVLETYSVDEFLQKGINVITGQEIEAVYLCGLHSHERNVLLKFCVQKGIVSYVIPSIGDLLLSGAKRVHMFHLPMLRANRYSPNPEYLFMKRVFDIFASGIMIIICSPIMLVTALLIRREDGGPVFYKQVRLTKDGKEFEMIKFRSMRIDAEKDGVARLSSGDRDDRITHVGRFIRKVRIDELPQLFNIIKGEMSIVGPRPERPEIAAEYDEILPEFRLRLQAKAGLTGLAQVYGKYNTSPYDKLRLDLMYISNPSILEDLRIMFATVKILFMPESTEGITEGSTTAIDYTNNGDCTETKDETGKTE